MASTVGKLRRNQANLLYFLQLLVNAPASVQNQIRDKFAAKEKDVARW